MRRNFDAFATLLPAVFWLVGCGADKQVEPSVAPQTPPPPKHDPLEEEMFRVGQIRQLPVVRHVKMSKLARPALAKEVEAYVQRETPPSFIEGQGAILKLLGMVPQNFDYLAANIALMKAQLAGYYDPDRQTMVLADDLGKEEENATLLHELVHALQDQNFELGKRLKQGPLMGDKLAALHTLAEGDATSAMLGETLRAQGYDINQLSNEMLAERMRQDFSMQNPEVPAVIKRAALAPYLDGLSFVNELRRSGGWKLVDRTWTDPPQSTEQLLHPEKHAAKEGWRQFASPVAPKSGCELVYEDVVGEQGLKIVFEEWVFAIGRRSGRGGLGRRSGECFQVRGSICDALADFVRCRHGWRKRPGHRDVPRGDPALQAVGGPSRAHGSTGRRSRGCCGDSGR